MRLATVDGLTATPRRRGRRHTPSSTDYAGRLDSIGGDSHERLPRRSPALVAVVFLALGAAKILALPPMRARAAHARLLGRRLPAIGALEIAGAGGRRCSA